MNKNDHSNGGKYKNKMEFRKMDLRNEIIEVEEEVNCPSCGSEEVVIESSRGYFLVVYCRDCGYSFGG